MALPLSRARTEARAKNIDFASHADLAGLIGYETVESDTIGTKGDRLYVDE